MKTIVPAPKRVNPDAVARRYWWIIALTVDAVLMVTLWSLAEWKPNGDPANAPAIPAMILTMLHGVALLLGLCVGTYALADNWHDVADWWAEREAAYDEVSDR